MDPHEPLPGRDGAIEGQHELGRPVQRREASGIDRHIAEGRSRQLAAAGYHRVRRDDLPVVVDDVAGTRRLIESETRDDEADRGRQPVVGAEIGAQHESGGDGVPDERGWLGRGDPFPRHLDVVRVGTVARTE